MLRPFNLTGAFVDAVPLIISDLTDLVLRGCPFCLLSFHPFALFSYKKEIVKLLSFLGPMKLSAKQIQKGVMKDL